MSLTDIFAVTVSPFELMLRGTVMFWFLYLLFRFVIRRGAGSIGVSDFLFVVILGDAAQNAMIGDGKSLADGAVLILTLVFWNVLIDYLGSRFPAVEALLSARRTVLVEQGRMNRRNMRKEFISADELMTKIREDGLESLDSVKFVYLESDGELSIIKADRG